MHERLLKKAANELLKPPVQLLEKLGKLAAEGFELIWSPTLSEEHIRRLHGEMDGYEAPAAPNFPELVRIVRLSDETILELDNDNTAVVVVRDDPRYNHLLVTHMPEGSESFVGGYFEDPDLLKEFLEEGFPIVIRDTALPQDKALYEQWLVATLPEQLDDMLSASEVR